MSIVFPSVGGTPAGTPVRTQFNCTDTATIGQAVHDSLVLSAWASEGTFDHFDFTFGPGVPSDGQTFTVNGVTYTFKNAPVGANDIQIPASPNNDGSHQATNFVAGAVLTNATAVVSSSTPPNAIVTITQTVSGLGANSRLTFSIGASGISVPFGWTHGQGRGYKMISTPTDHGLTAAYYIEDNDRGENFVEFHSGSADGVLVSPIRFKLDVASGRTLEMRSLAHEFDTWLFANDGTRGTRIGMCIPFIPKANRPIKISNVTVSGTTVTVTTSIPHPYTEGLDVFLSEIGGLTGVNAFFTIHVIDSTHFSFTAPSVAGSYTGGGLVASSRQTARAFLDWGDYEGGGNFRTWRNNLFVQRAFVCYNQYSYNYDQGSIGSGNARLDIPIPGPSLSGGRAYSVGGYSWILEPVLSWPLTDVASVRNRIGQRWGSFVFTDSAPMDQVNLGFQGHNWELHTNNADYGDGVPFGGLWMAKS